MGKNLTIIDKDYLQWVKDLALRYRQSQIKAAVKVNQEVLAFYYSLGKDIVEMNAEAKWGSKFLHHLSRDLKEQLPDVEGFSPTNLLYIKNFYILYSNLLFTPQPGERMTSAEITPQLGEHFAVNIFSIPWGHHKLLIDKYKNKPEVALFYVRKTIEHGWSRAMLLNFLDTNLYKRQN